MPRWPLAFLFASAMASSLGAPAPTEGLLTLAGAGLGHVPVAWALAAGAFGFALGDAICFLVLRAGVFERLPERWRRRVPRTLDRLGPRTVWVSRMIPGSALVNVAAAASPIPARSFLAAAALGDIVYALLLIAAGAGGGAVFARSPLLAGALGAALLALAVLVWRRRRLARAVG